MPASIELSLNPEPHTPVAESTRTPSPDRMPAVAKL
jgi:hypothetical protein